MLTFTGMLGVAAGIATAFSWGISAYIHASLARVLGVHGFMLFRQPLAAVILFFLCIFLGQFSHQPAYIWLMALLSGFLGIGIADWCGYECFARIGLRAGVVFLSLSTSMTALMAVLFLGEYLGLQGALGIALATLGVIVVVRAEKSRTTCDKKAKQEQDVSIKDYIAGVGLGLLSAFLLAVSFVMSKEALNASMSPLMLTFVRNVAASILLWIMALRFHRVRSSITGLREHPELIKYFLWGCFVGPVGGIWISSVALEYAGAAVGATLIGLQPIATLIITGVMERRLPPWGAIGGAVVACSGAAILILR